MDALFAARRGCFAVDAELAMVTASSFVAAAGGVAVFFATRRDFAF